MNSTTIPKNKRVEGCLVAIRNNFDFEKAVAFMMKSCADEPAMQRVKNPEKLAENCVRMGGTGAQRKLNIFAFQEAVQRYSAENHRRETNKLNADLEAQNAEIERLREKNGELEQSRYDLVQQVSDLQAELRKVEVAAAQNALAAPASEDPPGE